MRKIVSAREKTILPLDISFVRYGARAFPDSPKKNIFHYSFN